MSTSKSVPEFDVIQELAERVCDEYFGTTTTHAEWRKELHSIVIEEARTLLRGTLLPDDYPL